MHFYVLHLQAIGNSIVVYFFRPPCYMTHYVTSATMHKRISK